MKVTVPTSLADIKLYQYQEYLEAIKQSENEKDGELFLAIKSMEIFCGVSESEMMLMNYDIVTTIVERIKQILLQEPKRVEFFKIGNIKFGWLPKLDDMTYGEFIDLNGNISEWDTIIVSMGVLYRPVTKEFRGKYLVEDYKGDSYHDALKHMLMDAVVGAMVFFWNLGLDCLTYMTTYLEEQKMKMSLPNQQNLVEDGIGMQQSMNLLEATLRSFKV